MEASLFGEYEKSLQSMYCHMGVPAETFTTTTLKGHPGMHVGYRYFFIGEDQELRCHEVYFKGDVWKTTFLGGKPTWVYNSSSSLLEDSIRVRQLSQSEISDPKIRSKIDELLKTEKMPGK